jgi:hypoxanthine phosphoribosyltransferase
MKPNTLLLADEEFELLIPHTEIEERINDIACQLNNRFKNEIPVILPILDGASIFASNLIQKLDIDCMVSFLKYKSYSGVLKAKESRELLGLDVDLRGRTVIIVEDIVDTGLTMEHILRKISKSTPGKVILVSLLFKPDACVKNIKIDYLGMEIPNYFVIGYGLDYEGLGRNLKDIYKLKS